MGRTCVPKKMKRRANPTTTERVFDACDYITIWEVLFAQMNSEDVCRVVIPLLSCSSSLFSSLAPAIKGVAKRLSLTRKENKFLNYCLEESRVMTKRNAYLLFACINLLNMNPNPYFVCFGLNELDPGKSSKLRLSDVMYYQKETGVVVPSFRVLSTERERRFPENYYQGYPILSDENLSFRSNCFIYCKNTPTEEVRMGTGFAKKEKIYSQRLYLFLKEIDVVMKQ